MSRFSRVRRVQIDHTTANGSAAKGALLSPAVWLVLVAGSLLSVLLALALARQNADGRQVRFRADAQVAGAAVQQQFTSGVHDLDALRSLFVSSTAVSREEFATYVQLHHHSFAVPGLIGLAWAPRVPAEQRAGFEAAVQAAGVADYALWEPGPGGERRPVATRDDYYPIDYIAPPSGADAMLGLDLGASGQTAIALRRAADTGQSQVVAGVRLSATMPHTDTLLVVQPIYHGGLAYTTIGERREELAGYIVGLYSLSELLASALGGLPAAGYNLYLFGATAPDSTPVYRMGATPDPAGTAEPAPTLAHLLSASAYSRQLTVDGTPWLLVATPATGEGGWDGVLPWVALASGLAVTALSATYLHKRQQTERNLRSERTLLRTLLDAIPDLVTYRDTNGVLLGYNRAFAATHNAGATDLIGQLAATLPGTSAADDGQYGPTESLPGDMAPGDVAPGGDPTLSNRRQWVTSADGAHLLYETLVAPLYDPKGGVTGVLEVSRDVTASWRTAQLLQARLALSEFAGGHTLEELLRRALDQAEALTSSRIGFFHFWDDDQQALSLQTWSTNTLATTCTAQPQDRHYPLNEAGIWADCARTRQPHVCNDYAALGRETEHMPAGHSLVTRFLAIPILRGDQVTAVMGVGNKAFAYDAADLAAVAQFADAAWDVILRKRAEDAVAVSLEKYRVLFESFPLGITISDKRGAIVEANAESERLLGLSVAQHTERTIDSAEWRVIRPDGEPMPAEEYASVRALQENRLVRNVKMGIVKPDQGITWITVTAAPIPLEDYGLAITYADITEQHQLERIQAAQYAVSRVLADSPEFGEATSQVLQSVAQELGWDGVELWLPNRETRRLAWFWAWHRPDHAGLARLVAESRRYTFGPGEGGPGAVWATNIPLWEDDLATSAYPRGPLGKECGLHAGAVIPVPVSDQVMGVMAFVSVHRMARDERMIQCLVDIGQQIGQFAARKYAEAELNAERALLAQRVEERTAELAYALRAKDEFLANMSHELRTPLHGILTLAESLAAQINGPLSERQARAVDLIQQSGQHLLELINDVLDLAKVEAGKLTIEPETVAVNALCRSSVQLVREMATKQGVRLTLDLEDSDLTLEADGRRLKQVLVNLLSNAIKFTPMGGSVQLRVRPDTEAGELSLAVIDTGIGIPPEQIGRLFQPFTQLDAGLTRRHEGTGLGLALVRRLVELHGGRVSAASEGIPGRGSRFTVTLPWQPSAPAPQPTQQPAAPPETAPGTAPVPQVTANGTLPPAPSAATGAGTRAGITAGGATAERGVRPGQATVLVAEDNDLNRTAVGDYLANCGYRVLMAANGLEAIALAAEQQPNLILMDVQMPVLDGLEAVRRLRAEPGTRAIPVIMLTALAMVGDRERCLAAGADAYLAKPITLRALTEQIEALLAAHPGVTG